MLVANTLLSSKNEVNKEQMKHLYKYDIFFKVLMDKKILKTQEKCIEFKTDVTKVIIFLLLSCISDSLSVKDAVGHS